MIASALLALLAATPPGAEAPRRAPLSGAELERQTREVAELLRCPVCQGLSVADSPATMARNMKQEVHDKLAAGYDQEQIIADFERSYGEFVRLEPPMRGANWLVWFGPLLALAAGGFAVTRALRRWSAQTAAPAGSAPPARDSLPDDPRLAAAILRVRALAYGWPDGVPPKESTSR